MGSRICDVKIQVYPFRLKVGPTALRMQCNEPKQVVDIASYYGNYWY